MVNICHGSMYSYLKVIHCLPKTLDYNSSVFYADIDLCKDKKKSASKKQSVHIHICII